MPYASRPPRYPTHIPVVVTKAGKPQSATIVDINAYGACLAGITDLDMEDKITLRGAVSSNFATVRWRDDDRSGVYFERPIPPQHLALLRLRGTTPPIPSNLAEIRAV